MLRTIPLFATAGGPAPRGRANFDRAWQLMGGGRHGHGHGHARHGGHGGPRGSGFPFGWGPFGDPSFGPGGGRRGRRARRGDVRTAVLLLLAEEPRNGYQIMQELEERSDGAWRPSAGSVYPALQLLEDEGLVRSEEVDGRKLLHLTDAGRQLLEERGTDRPAPWDELAGDVSDDARAIMKVVREVMVAVTQVIKTGSDTQREQTRRLLVGLRRDLYLMLAEGDEDEAADRGGDA